MDFSYTEKEMWTGNSSEELHAVGIVPLPVLVVEYPHFLVAIGMFGELEPFAFVVEFGILACLPLLLLQANFFRGGTLFKK